MTKYRKRPVVIDAVQFTGNEKIVDLFDFLDGAEWEAGKDGIRIQTLEGEHLARPGDWIIRGIQGEFYPCKPDIFVATYERVPA